MDIKETLKKLDLLYKTDRPGVEPFLTGCIMKAEQEKDYESLVSLYNEGIGFYRDRGRFGECRRCCEGAKEALSKLGMEGSVPYATTLLNIATAYRAFGNLEEPEGIYSEVSEIYGKRLSKNDYLYAALYNNISLLREKQGRYGEAVSNLKKALEIVKGYPEAKIEIATSEINLASALLKTNHWREASEHIQNAMAIYLPDHTDSFHYSMALGTMGEYLFREGNFKEAEAMILLAMETLEKKMGRTPDYALLERNLQMVRKELGKG
ncbi:MAG: tetratricopeptide repeat protein [Lachnospiraceae bacterium]|nr:tetratricopeptide repeat protein [Lachnospiraceae bacterium]